MSEPIKAAVLGSDVSKSRSPAIHHAAFAAMGIEGEYRAISVDARGFAGVVKHLGEDGYRYLNVTIPHKRAAAALAENASPLVRATRAANTLLLRKRRGGEVGIRGDNTDAYGLLAALADLGVVVGRGQTHVLVGSGGAAAGGAAALLDAGAHVRLVARRPTVARAMRRSFPERQRERIEVFPWSPAGLTGALAGAGALISAVPAVAWAGDEAQAGLRGIDRGAAVLEMAYGSPTPLAEAARAYVSRYQDGIPMLVHQAARAIELALGELPPVEPLLRAARAS